jgi:hypothetical protein
MYIYIYIYIIYLYIYGYSILDTTPQQLSNYLLVLAKTTIYKTCLATNSTHRHTPEYQRHVPREATILAVDRDALQPVVT